MSASKRPYRCQPDAKGVVRIQPNMRSLAHVDLILNKDEAIAKAKKEAADNRQYRFVIPFDEGFIVLSYSDLWDYFDDEMKKECVFRV